MHNFASNRKRCLTQLPCPASRFQESYLMPPSAGFKSLFRVGRLSAFALPFSNPDNCSFSFQHNILAIKSIVCHWRQGEDCWFRMNPLFRFLVFFLSKDACAQFLNKNILTFLHLTKWLPVVKIRKNFEWVFNTLFSLRGAVLWFTVSFD